MLGVEHAGHQGRGRLAQQPLDVRDAEQPAGRRLERGAADVHDRGQRRGEVLVAHVGQRLGDGGVRRQDHRLRRHHAAGRLLAVDHQAADLGGVLALHQLEQLLGGLGREVGDQVGGVVGRHLLEDVGGALGVEVLEDLDLVLLGQLLQHVGQPLVVERGHHLAAPLRRELVDDVGGVGRAQVGQRGDQVLGALVVLAVLEPVDVVPLDDVGLGPCGGSPWTARPRRPATAPSRGCGPAPWPRRRRCPRRRCCGSAPAGRASGGPRASRWSASRSGACSAGRW